MQHSYGQYLEELRISRNITREEFVKDIMSERQYRRYITNQSSIQSDKLFQLIDKLSISVNQFMSTFYERNDEITKQLFDAYDNLRNRHFVKSRNTLKEIDSTNLNNYNRQLYDFIDNTLDFNQEIITKQIFVKKCIDLSGYPDSLENNSISFVFLLFSIQIMRYCDDKSVVNQFGKVLYNVLISEDYHPIGRSIQFMPNVYSSIIRLLLINEELEKGLSVCEKAIEFCDNSRVFSNMKNILYYAVYSSDKLGLENNKEKYKQRLNSLMEYFPEKELNSQITEKLNRIK